MEIKYKRMKRNLLLALPLLACVCFACKEEPDLITLKEEVKTLYVEDKYQIEVSSATPVEYVSENDYYAQVSESGVVTAGHVGETFVTLSNGVETRKLKVTVEPQSNLYPEPYLDFGISKNDFIDKYGAPDTNAGDVITYRDYSTAASFVMYVFDNDSTLKSVAVSVKGTYSPELGKFLAERYFCIDLDNLYFINGLTLDDADMVVSASLTNLTSWTILYVPNASSHKSSTLQKDLSSLSERTLSMMD